PIETGLLNPMTQNSILPNRLLDPIDRISEWLFGLIMVLSYRRLKLYSEGEYVFDTDDSSGNFFYNWSELAFSPIDWFRGGLVAQRTKAYETDLDIQRG